MNIFILVISGFLAAGLAPLLTRWLPDRVGWALALLPAGYTLYLLSLASGLATNGPSSKLAPGFPHSKSMSPGIWMD